MYVEARGERCSAAVGRLVKPRFRFCVSDRRDLLSRSASPIPRAPRGLNRPCSREARTLGVESDRSVRRGKILIARSAREKDAETQRFRCSIGKCRETVRGDSREEETSNSRDDLPQGELINRRSSRMRNVAWRVPCVCVCVPYSRSALEFRLPFSRARERATPTPTSPRRRA